MSKRVRKASPPDHISGSRDDHAYSITYTRMRILLR